MYRWLTVGFLLLLSLASPPVARAQAEAITLDDYWALVERSLEVVASLEAELPTNQRSALNELAYQWEDIRSVSLQDGRIVKIDPTYLVALFRSDTIPLIQIRQSLEALQEAQSVPPRVFTQEDSGAVQPILAQPEFQWQQTEPSFLQQWGERFFRRLNDLLNSLFGNQELEGSTSLPTVNIFSLFAVVVFAILMFVVFRSLLGSLVSESYLSSVGESLDDPLTAENALHRAQRLSQGGDYRSAVRFLYLSSLLLLEERGLLRYDRSKTNREVLQSVNDQPELKQPLQNIIDVFDQVWYGYQPLDQEHYEHYEADVLQIKEQRK